MFSVFLSQTKSYKKCCNCNSLRTGEKACRQRQYLLLGQMAGPKAAFFDLPPSPHTNFPLVFQTLKLLHFLWLYREIKEQIFLSITLCLAKYSTFHLLLGLLLSTDQPVPAILVGFLDMLGDALKDYCQLWRKTSFKKKQARSTLSHYTIITDAPTEFFSLEQDLLILTIQTPGLPLYSWPQSPSGNLF